MKINTQNIFYGMARMVAAIIMLQTLYFKFTGAEESIYIFTAVGMEPWGRIAVGIFELIASVLILINSTAWIGGFIALGLMAGAIMMHITLLGIEVKGDGGQLFIYAVLVALCSLYILFKNKQNITMLYERIKDQ